MNGNMNRFHVQLTTEETNWLSQIDFELGGHHRDGHAAFLANQKPILALLKSLSNRNAIPEARLKYWGDPEYNTGRIKGSHKDMFVRNGNRGTEIYTHPHFLPYLRYFIFGADLPESLISSFEEKVGDPKWISSSDIVPMGKQARILIGEFHLSSDAPEEFFKLCLDMGLSQRVASSVRDSAKQAR